MAEIDLNERELLRRVKRWLILEVCSSMNRDQAAQVLGMGTRTIQMFLRSEGFHPREKIEGSYKVDRDTVRALLERSSEE